MKDLRATLVFCFVCVFLSSLLSLSCQIIWSHSAYIFSNPCRSLQILLTSNFILKSRQVLLSLYAQGYHHSSSCSTTTCQEQRTASVAMGSLACCQFCSHPSDFRFSRSLAALAFGLLYNYELGKSHYNLVSFLNWKRPYTFYTNMFTAQLHAQPSPYFGDRVSLDCLGWPGHSDFPALGPWVSGITCLCH